MKEREPADVRIRRYMRGEIMRRSSPRRNAERDEILRMIFSKPGFASVIAEHLGVSPQSVSAWDRIPAQYVLDIAPLLRMRPDRIRPDVFGRMSKNGKRRLVKIKF